MAEEKRVKRSKLITPKSTCGYTWLNKPDTKFSDKGVYKISQTYDAETAQPLIEKMEEIFLAEYDKKLLSRASFPYRIDEETGDVTFTFKSSKQPKLYDAKGNPIKKNINVGNGSTVKSAVSMGAYKTGVVCGVSAYLDAVQIIDLVEFGANKTLFTSEDGFTISEHDQMDEDEGFADTSTVEDGNF